MPLKRLFFIDRLLGLDIAFICTTMSEDEAGTEQELDIYLGYTTTFFSRYNKLKAIFLLTQIANSKGAIDEGWTSSTISSSLVGLSLSCSRCSRLSLAGSGILFLIKYDYYYHVTNVEEYK